MDTQIRSQRTIRCGLHNVRGKYGKRELSLKYPDTPVGWERSRTDACLMTLRWYRRYLGMPGRLQLYGRSNQSPDRSGWRMGRCIPLMGQCEKHRFLPVPGKGFSLRLERAGQHARAEFLCQNTYDSRACLGKTQENQGTIR